MTQITVGFLYLSAFIVLQIGESVATALRSKSQGSSLPPRPRRRTGTQLIVGQFITTVFVLLIVTSQDWRWAWIGFRGWAPSLIGFVVGMVLYYLVFGSVYRRILMRLGKYESQLIAAYLAHRQLWPRQNRQRRLFLVGLGINPFTEEIIYRGFLVYFLGQISSEQVTFILIGLICCLLTHLYQGWRLQLFHSIFYFMTVGLLYSPFGLAASIGFHLVGDFLPVQRIPLQMETWARSERRRRESKKALL